MRYRRIHPWSVTIPRARRIQETLRGALDLTPAPSALSPRLVAGADVSYDRGSEVIYSAVVVLSWPDLVPVEVASAVGRTSFPYVPGYLSFREIPILLRAFRKLRHAPDVILCDGQGIAHPRGLGLASHLGLVLGLPSIGCAKTRLVGEHLMPRAERGSTAPLMYDGRRVGTVLRTRDGVAPIYVSPGHAIDARTATRIVLRCCSTRIPEPTRRAHIEVNRLRREHGAARQPGDTHITRSRADQIGVAAPMSRPGSNEPVSSPDSSSATRQRSGVRPPEPAPQAPTQKLPRTRARPWEGA